MRSSQEWLTPSSGCQVTEGTLSTSQCVNGVLEVLVPACWATGASPTPRLPMFPALLLPPTCSAGTRVCSFWAQSCPPQTRSAACTALPEASQPCQGQLGLHSPYLTWRTEAQETSSGSPPHCPCLVSFQLFIPPAPTPTLMSSGQPEVPNFADIVFPLRRDVPLAARSRGCSLRFQVAHALSHLCCNVHQFKWAGLSSESAEARGSQGEQDSARPSPLCRLCAQGRGWGKGADGLISNSWNCGATAGLAEVDSQHITLGISSGNQHF